MSADEPSGLTRLDLEWGPLFYSPPPPIPEYRLLEAVLLRAIADATKQVTNDDGRDEPWQKDAKKQNEALRLDARRWINGAWAPLTFNFICEALNVDPDWLRDLVFKAIEGGRTLENLRGAYSAVVRPEGPKRRGPYRKRAGG